MGLNSIVLGRQNQALTDFTARPERYGVTAGSSNQTSVNSGGSIASGYRLLRKNGTLAGRELANNFNGKSDSKPDKSRLRMVSKLRKKERFMIWRNIWYDLTRYFLTGFVRFSPRYLFNSSEITNSAVRFRNR